VQRAPQVRGTGKPIPGRPGRRAGLRAALLAFAAYFLLAAGLNAARGAMASHFGSHQDEPSHVVNGLLVRDYLVRSELPDPLAFARQYYLHYPKVAIGQWPPGFYVLQLLWTLPFGVSRVSLVLLMSSVGALAATAVFLVLRRELGAWYGALGGLLLLLLPGFQTYGSRVLTEVPLALLLLLASLQFGRFLRTGRTRDAVGFALIACAAILTKGSALCLALLPPFAIGIAGRWDRLRHRGPWIAAAIVGAVCGPWYAYALGISKTTWGQGSSLDPAHALEVLPGYADGLVRLGGPMLLVLALFGIGVALLDGERRERWAAPLALIPSLLAILAITPVGADPRHLVPLAPVWVMAAVLCAWWVGEHLLSLRSRVPVVLLGACAWFGVETLELPSKRNTGYQEAVAGLLADPGLDDAVFLIAGDAIGEGAFVSEVALEDRRPGHVVLRGSKVLSKSTWSGAEYASFFTTTAELDAYLRSIPVGVVAVDLSSVEREWFEHMTLLCELLAERPEAWKPIGAFDVVRNGEPAQGGLRLYRLEGFEALPKRALDVATALGNRRCPGVPLAEGAPADSVEP
jgi:hypothetical protein